jgi:hypothetical protein
MPPGIWKDLLGIEQTYHVWSISRCFACAYGHTRQPRMRPKHSKPLMYGAHQYNLGFRLEVDING